MRCPECRKDVDDGSATVCPHCGASLRGREGEATDRLDRGRLTADAGTEPAPPEQNSGAPLAALAAGWPEAAVAALTAFLAVLLVGAVMLLAAKFQNPNLGSGADPVSVLVSIVIIALGSLGVPIRIDELEISVLPLGALVAAGATIAWATAAHLRRNGTAGDRPGIEAVKIALVFALLCLLAALLFRFGGTHSVSADPFRALILGLGWGGAFAALGTLHADQGVRAWLRATLQRVRSRSASLYGGLLGGGAMVAISALLAAGAGLLWLIARLATGGPSRAFGVGDAAAGLLFILAFVPNILVAIVTVSLGAPIGVGARLTFGGRVAGPLRDYSLFDWPGGAPWYAYLALLLPVAACLTGGYVARRRSPGVSVVKVLGFAAITYSVSLVVLARLGRARLGAELVTERGFGLVAPDVGFVFLLALVWATLLGYVGWRLAEARS